MSVGTNAIVSPAGYAPKPGGGGGPSMVGIISMLLERFMCFFIAFASIIGGGGGGGCGGNIIGGGGIMHIGPFGVNNTPASTNGPADGSIGPGGQPPYGPMNGVNVLPTSPPP